MPPASDSGDQIDEARSIQGLEELAAVMRDRRRQLGWSQIELDARSGLPDGYTAKLEAIVTNPAASNARGLGRLSLPLMLGALELELVVRPVRR